MLGGSRDLQCNRVVVIFYKLNMRMRVVDERKKYLGNKWVIDGLITKIKFNILWLSRGDEKYDRKSVLITCT